MNTGPVGVRRLLFLVGFMGSGKTTVGRVLAGRLGWNFFDLDEEIEQRARRSIAQIFTERGEPYFRELESALLEEILTAQREKPTVVALGGGTIAQPQNLERIREQGGILVWLRCPLEELQRRCSRMANRPLFRDPASFQQLYQQRLPYYQQADFIVDVADAPPASIVDTLFSRVVLQCT